MRNSTVGKAKANNTCVSVGKAKTNNTCVSVGKAKQMILLFLLSLWTLIFIAIFEQALLQSYPCPV